MHILTPWRIQVNFDDLQIEIKKRNWFLIGFDSTTAPFRYIRRVDVDTHLFGADLNLKIYGSGTLSVMSISKSDANNIKNRLLDFNNKIGNQGRVIH